MLELLKKLDAMAEVEATLRPASDTSAKAAEALRQLLEKLQIYEGMENEDG